MIKQFRCRVLYTGGHPPLRAAAAWHTIVTDKDLMMLHIHDAIDSNPKKLSGEVCFAGTRVPVRTLFDCLAEGYT